ncbi:hypothetical protein VT84_08040 [Gemmata sp. SH-PL17]|uniref:MauE/DoxX family redox-associated membrane protein n=1 Tax=Gemmata sp. SH-PL17 TaxID=1630693 RepID=UPI0004BC2559|nr:MauE/DoxX family redox-associated membrane protein [Gemmata sp. SH-PL17]AMV24332.1 hypothetical protein VT84_08040 [Gemmata sp. SH-PL17]
MNPRPTPGYAALSVILGLTLAAAGGLKTAETLLGAPPPPLGSGRLPAALLSGWPVVEFALGLWLASGARPSAARAVGIVLLLAFSGLTLHQVVTGLRDCGCFGPVKVPPTATLAFDLTMLAGLVALKPRLAEPPARRWAVAAAVGLFVGCAALPALLRPAPAERFEVIDSSDWVGRRFPLLEETDIADRLRAGAWLVVLHRSGCEECRRQVPRLTEQARLGGASVALVEVPTVGGEAGDMERGIGVPGRLRADRTWIVQTPLAVWVRDGVVTGFEPASP